MQEFQWVQKYRPRKIEDCILPQDIKTQFLKFRDDGDLPNVALIGSQGMGKTTVIMALMEELGIDHYKINASLNGNIDTLRNDILSYATTMSFTGGRKFVILDEADNLNAQSTQPALRAFIEEYSRNCGFALTANFKNRLIPPLLSRMAVVDFKFLKKDRPELAMQFLKRVEWILEQEGVTFEREAVFKVIKTHFPDFRRTLNELQAISQRSSRVITKETVDQVTDVSFKPLIGLMREKNFTGVRTWVGEQVGLDQNTIFRRLFDTASEYVEKSSIPQLVLIIGEYQYKASFVADQEINLMACLVEVMADVVFKPQ
jgi:DNA polymerase III delta prime subunit